MIKQDNTHVWVRNVVYTIKDAETSNIRFGVMSMTNISDRKAYEQSFLNLIKTLAHDLITPLGHIESYTALIKENGHISDSSICYLDIISQSAAHARNIVIDVLENATLDKENFEKYKELTDINHLLYTYLSSFIYILYIEDTGVGIPDKLLVDLFKPFSKAQRKGLKGERSTGLGTYIVRQIIPCTMEQFNLKMKKVKELR